MGTHRQGLELSAEHSFGFKLLSLDRLMIISVLESNEETCILSPNGWITVDVINVHLDDFTAYFPAKTTSFHGAQERTGAGGVRRRLSLITAESISVTKARKNEANDLPTRYGNLLSSSRTLSISALSFLHVSGFLRRKYIMKESHLEVVSWPAMRSVSMFALMVESGKLLPILGCFS
jgi:hypothetical protein